MIYYQNKKRWENIWTRIQGILATKITLNAENIEQTIYFVSGLEKLQQIKKL